MKYTKAPQKNRTEVFEVVIPVKDIKANYKKALAELKKDAKVEGFRKGKASAELVEKSLGKERIYDEMIQQLLPEIYKDIITKEKLEPVIAPKVELVEAKEGKDWKIKMSVALQPKVTVPDYKKIVKDVRADMKKDDIWVPGKGDPTKDEELDKEAMEKRDKHLNEVLKKLLDKTKIEISDIILEQEINQRLTRLLDDIRKIGLSMEGYLESRNTTQEKIKADFREDILNTYKLEFALSEIGDKEKITVEQKEIDDLIEGMPDEESKKQAKQNAYAYGMMLRKQKILDFLGSL